MNRLKYAPRSIDVYIPWLVRLKDFYPDKDLSELNLAHIKGFIDHQVSMVRVSPSSINIGFHAFRLLYNKVWGRDYDFKSINRPKVNRPETKFLSEDEIRILIDSTTDIKHRALIALTYSSGLDLSEVGNLKLKDIDYNRNVVTIRDRNGKYKRDSILGECARSIVKAHVQFNSPRRFLFEGLQAGHKYSDRSIQHMFQRNLTRAGITKKLTFKALKYSYILHLESLGVSLRTTLKELGFKHTASLDFFSAISSKGERITFSPLDKIIYAEKADSPIDVSRLEESISLMQDREERAYLHEALLCINSGSLRAGIIFAWNAAVVNIRKKCMSDGMTKLNQAIQKHYQKAPTISNVDDLADIRDSTLLLAFQSLGHVDKGEKDALGECLDLRNKCGHPSQYRPKSLKAMSFLEDLLTLVFNKQRGWLVAKACCHKPTSSRCDYPHKR